MYALKGSPTSRSQHLSFRAAWGCWVVFVLIIMSSYESNLRAYLMTADYEKPVDTEQDMLDRKWKLYLPSGVPFKDMMLASPIKAQRTLAEQVVDNLDEQEFFYDEQGLTPIALEKKMIQNGKLILINI